MVATRNQSAGLLLCRRCPEGTDATRYFLVHPGGPLWARKDAGAWTIPKGLVDAGEDPLQAAIREFTEETGWAVDTEHFEPLGHVDQKAGKRVHGWAFVGDCDPATLRSNTFEMQWPPKSGRLQRFPEVDRGALFELAEAKLKINPAQIPLLERAASWLASTGAARTGRSGGVRE